MSLYSASHRPRLLLAGEEGQGQTTHLAPSIMHHMERLPVHVLDLPALYAVSARTPEESCAQVCIDMFLLLDSTYGPHNVIRLQEKISRKKASCGTLV